MRTILAVSSVALACAGLTYAQIGRTFDWHTAAGDAQRTGFEHSDTKFTKSDVKNFTLVVKDELKAGKKSSSYLLPPVLIGTLVSYRGFKELAFVANGSGDLWAIDVDLDRMFWQRHIDLPKVKRKPTAACPGGITSDPTMEPGATFGRRRRAGARGAGREDFFKKIFAPRTLFVLGADGKLYRLDTSTGKDMNPPVSVMPPGARVGDLNAAEDVIYASTSHGCAAVPNMIFAVDLSGEKPKVVNYASPAPEGFVGKEGVLLGSDDDVYAQTTNTVQVLSPKDLKVEQTFSGALGDTSPVAFEYKDRDLIVAAAKDGSLYLLDTKSMNLPLSQTSPIAANGDKGIVGLASWESSEGTRWVLVAVSGPLAADTKPKTTNGDTPNGSIVALQLTEQDGKPVLTPAWVSPDLANTEAPVIANGVVFALSAGETKKKGKLGGHAVLYGLDGDTGKGLWSSGDQVTAPANLSGLTVANGRVYFSTTDSTFYGFGYHLPH